MEKTIVEVLARHDTLGKVHPLRIKWTDGRVFEIDRVTDARMAPSLKSGGHGMRYTCRALSLEFYRFKDGGKWFVERK